MRSNMTIVGAINKMDKSSSNLIIFVMIRFIDEKDGCVDEIKCDKVTYL